MLIVISLTQTNLDGKSSVNRFTARKIQKSAKHLFLHKFCDFTSVSFFNPHKIKSTRKCTKINHCCFFFGFHPQQNLPQTIKNLNFGKRVAAFRYLNLILKWIRKHLCANQFLLVGDS